MHRYSAKKFFTLAGFPLYFAMSQSSCSGPIAAPTLGSTKTAQTNSGDSNSAQTSTTTSTDTDSQSTADSSTTTSTDTDSQSTADSSNTTTSTTMAVDLSKTPSKLFQLVGIMGNGQSLSVGAAAGLVLPTVKTPGPYANNLKLQDSSGKYSNPQSTSLSLVPLTEPFRPQVAGKTYPTNIFGETFHGMMSQQMSELSQSKFQKDLVSVHSVTGLAGAVMRIIKKGGTGVNYSGGIFEANAIKKLADASQKSFGYGAVVLTHGESDWYTAGYERMLATMQNDYNTDLSAITHQTLPIPMFLSQQATFPTSQSSPYTFEYVSTQTQWLAPHDYPGKIYMIGPKYQYKYVDGVHLVPESYEDYGRKAAEVYFRVMELKEDWSPLEPIAVKAQDATKIRVTFHVPVAPLKWSTTLPSPHKDANKEWAEGKGFELLAADGSHVAISSVAIDGADVVITTTANTADIASVRYAMTQDASNGGRGGSEKGRIGLLQDSDAMIDQPNFAVSFSYPVTHGNPSELKLEATRVDDFYYRAGRLWATGDIFEADSANLAGDGTPLVGRNMKYKDTGKDWVSVPAGAFRLNVDKKGIVLIASETSGKGGIKDGGRWRTFPALPDGELVGEVAGNGPSTRAQSYWAISRQSHHVFHYNQDTSAWDQIAGGLWEIDVDSSGLVWGVDRSQNVYRWDGSNWKRYNMKGIALSIADDDTVYIVAQDDRNVYHLPKGATTWVQDTKNGGYDRVAGAEPGKFFVSNGGSLYHN